MIRKLAIFYNLQIPAITGPQIQSNILNLYCKYIVFVKLKQLAKRQNRSLNNYVETLLLDAAYHEPNETTKAAMEEARSGTLRNAPALDMSSIEAMEKSMGL